MPITKQAGRFTVETNYNGCIDHGYVHGVKLRYVDGWNDYCETKTLNLSIEEMRDLYYILGRAIADAEK